MGTILINELANWETRYSNNQKIACVKLNELKFRKKLICYVDYTIAHCMCVYLRTIRRFENFILFYIILYYFILIHFNPF